ncbi:MAG: toprim domain-containing protein [Acutalibacteraceae bacterium]
MIKLSLPVIVEGKYDVIKLSNLIDGLIIKTDGFGIFKDKEKQQLLRRLAKEKGIILLTDSDSAGFMIRNFISSVVPKDKIINVYIPDIYGKEKRKTEGGKEGKLGVEGMTESVLLEAFTKAGVLAEKSENEKRRLITNIDLYEAGLSGRPDSSFKRKLLLKRLCLPERLSTSALVKILNTFVTYEEFIETVKELEL